MFDSPAEGKAAIAEKESSSIKQALHIVSMVSGTSKRAC